MAPVPVVQQPEHGKSRRTAEVSVKHAGGAGLTYCDSGTLACVFECQERKPALTPHDANSPVVSSCADIGAFHAVTISCDNPGTVTTAINRAVRQV